ncbi:MAG TPA: NACHT domain-containing protein, partial [Candidatus Obscuribacterales bacterium]
MGKWLGRYLGWIAIGVAILIVLALVKAGLTHEDGWWILVEPDYYGHWGILAGAGLVGIVRRPWAKTSPSQAQSIRDSTLTDSQTQQGQAGRDTYQFQGIGTVVLPGMPSPQAALSPDDIRHRQALLDKVRNSWIHGVLDKSLYSRARIALGLEDQPDRVIHPWSMDYSYANQREKLPTGMRLSKKLAELGEVAALLLLGDPGSGKTTMLLELAKDLLEAAQPEELDSGLPVVLNLSSWSRMQFPADGQPKLKTWLLEELRSKYQIPPAISTPWLEDQRLILLLDGLDEVVQEQRQDCLTAINQFRDTHSLMPMVVCCRVRDFEALRQKIAVPSAIFIQPLDLPQVDDYLAQGGDALAGIRAVLQQDRDLRNPDPDSLQFLAQTPLFLNIMALAYQAKTVDQIRAMPAQNQRQALFDAYINRMFAQRPDRPCYPKAKAIHWLRRLAQQLQQEGQTVFLIEYMQPKSWLETPRERWQHRLILGLIVGLIWGLILGLIVGLIWGLIVGLIVGLIWGLDSINPVESFQISMSRDARREIFRNLKDILIVVLMGSLIGGLVLVLMGGLMGGLILSLMGGLMGGL